MEENDPLVTEGLAEFSDKALFRELRRRRYVHELLEEFADWEIHDEHSERDLRHRYYEERSDTDRLWSCQIEEVNHAEKELYRGRPFEDVARDLLYKLLGVIV